MGKQGGIDMSDPRKSKTFSRPDLVHLAHTVFGADGLEPEQAQKLAQADIDEAHQSISAWLTEWLQSAELSICAIESAGPNAESQRSLREVQENLRVRRGSVTSLFEIISAHERPNTQYHKIITELDNLHQTLTEFIPKLARIQSPSATRWFDPSTPGFRLRTLIVPSKRKDAIDETLDNFKNMAMVLQTLSTSLRLAAALEEKRLAETRRLMRDFESYKQNLCSPKPLDRPFHQRRYRQSKVKPIVAMEDEVRRIYSQTDQDYDTA
ncbi:hypothetical protein O1611_g8763 [Lasiodiplodia mahajangana]|uniref:Uncharacterized protein n=1 Tax=Lasiodiplodia mahajangana TaxID=1108764 RepID=A0ACC2JBX7_9PEZI|nr:hypothetical protein O1611_g8763 [Lasiodiplodia mahajangana]